MPVSVVVGGQWGSEGKGKVALHVAERLGASGAIRVGGSNAGHTVVDAAGRQWKFRQLPVAAVLPGAMCFVAAGSYVDADVLLEEVERAGLDERRLAVDHMAVLIEQRHKDLEAQWEGGGRIGSTCSGTGAAVAARYGHAVGFRYVGEDRRLRRFVGDATSAIHDRLDRGERLVIEGTQGFGLSLLHSPDYPYVTSRDTTAASFCGEAGVGPTEVDHIAMAIRAMPIRVGGPSGPLPRETTWEAASARAGRDVVERTTVTNKVRRIADFDPGIVVDAITSNRPNEIYMNHVDYVSPDPAQREAFVARVEREIGQAVDWVGTDPRGFARRNGWAPPSGSQPAGP
jgi:adenylosuccinate synthase